MESHPHALTEQNVSPNPEHRYLAIISKFL